MWNGSQCVLAVPFRSWYFFLFFFQSAYSYVSYWLCSLSGYEVQYCIMNWPLLAYSVPWCSCFLLSFTKYHCAHSVHGSALQPPIHESCWLGTVMCKCTLTAISVNYAGSFLLNYCSSGRIKTLHVGSPRILINGSMLPQEFFWCLGVLDQEANWRLLCNTVYIMCNVMLFRLEKIHFVLDFLLPSIWYWIRFRLWLLCTVVHLCALFYARCF